MSTFEGFIDPRPAPERATGLVKWLRENLFSGVINSIVTVLMALFIFWVLRSFIGWLTTTPGWGAVIQNLKLFMVGSYPVGTVGEGGVEGSNQVWRVMAAAWSMGALLGLTSGVWKDTLRSFAIGFAVLSALVGLFVLFTNGNERIAYTIDPVIFWFVLAAILIGTYLLATRLGGRLRWPLVVLWLLSFPALWLLLNGGILGLERVGTNLWGGLLVTLALTIVGIIGSFPLGILLALGRRSNLPIVKLFCTLYIEVVRGVPLITFFFMAQLLLPLFLDAEIRVDNLIRSMVAVTLFSAAYLAENVRGGLQAIPRGQFEAAHALGLNYFYTTLFITLPQALRTVIPALVGQFIGLFKDTSLVSIVGILDLIGISAAVRAQPDWLGLPGGVFREVLFFLAVVYFIISFAMSRVSLQIERNLGVGTR